MDSFYSCPVTTTATQASVHTQAARVNPPSSSISLTDQSASYTPTRHTVTERVRQGVTFTQCEPDQTQIEQDLNTQPSAPTYIPVNSSTSPHTEYLPESDDLSRRDRAFLQIMDSRIEQAELSQAYMLRMASTMHSSSVAIEPFKGEVLDFPRFERGFDYVIGEVQLSFQEKLVRLRHLLKSPPH